MKNKIVNVIKTAQVNILELNAIHVTNSIDF